jgi:hypothetical protein
MSDITEVQVAKYENELTSFITAIENDIVKLMEKSASI